MSTPKEYRERVAAAQAAERERLVNSRTRWVLLVVAGLVLYAATRPDPPKHRVLHYAPTSIRLAVTDPYLGRADCIKIIEHYDGKLDRSGQVVVEKPAPGYDGRLHPWCYDNIDGRGPQFNDWPFNADPTVPRFKP